MKVHANELRLRTLKNSPWMAVIQGIWPLFVPRGGQRFEGGHVSSDAERNDQFSNFFLG